MFGNIRHAFRIQRVIHRNSTARTLSLASKSAPKFESSRTQLAASTSTVEIRAVRPSCMYRPGQHTEAHHRQQSAAVCKIETRYAPTAMRERKMNDDAQIKAAKA
jgi:hypothetical protein